MLYPQGDQSFGYIGKDGWTYLDTYVILLEGWTYFRQLWSPLRIYACLLTKDRDRAYSFAVFVFDCLLFY